MARPVTLFTGQWADLTLEELAKKAASWGYDGLELACWGDHFEVDKALEKDSYVQGRWDILNKYNLKCLAISTHLVGQCVADTLIDQRHRAILPDRLWGDGKLTASASAAPKKSRTLRAQPSSAWAWSTASPGRSGTCSTVPADVPGHD
jgi:sugar phosphate isomerase/epimerase